MSDEKPPVPPRLKAGDPGYEPILDDLTGFGGRYFDRDGNPISLRQAVELGHPGPDPDDPSGGYARVASDSLDEGNVWVSTVWLALDHNWTATGPPLIFETMVFVRCTEEQLEDRRRRWMDRFGFTDGFPWEDLECWRWATEEEARDGHRQVVDSLRMRIDLLADTGSENGGA